MTRQGEIIEVDFQLPDGQCKKHPALVISNEIEDAAGNFIYAILISTKNINPKYTIEITPEMLTVPMGRKSYFVTHLLDKFTPDYITQQRGVFVRPEYFNQVIQKTIKSIFNLELDIVDE